jgi:hypothetical protein
MLNLEVYHVSKEAVFCTYRLDLGRITIRNEQAPQETQTSFGRQDRALLSLRIGDIVPLDVARRLRSRDALVVQGVVSNMAYSPDTVTTEIGSGKAVGLVSRSLIDEQGRIVAVSNDEVPTPSYPLEALAAGEEGVVVANNAGRDVQLVSSSGKAGLDAAVTDALKQRRLRGLPFFTGQHRVQFEVLKR